MNLEILARLNAKPNRYDALPGGRAGITQQDVAAMLRHLRPHEEWLLRAKYAGDTSNLSDLQGWWLAALTEKAADDQWSGKSGQIDALSRETLAEHLGSRACVRCSGRGQVENGRKVVACGACDGSGQASITRSDRSMARRLGYKRLDAAWKSKVDWCRRELWRVEASAIDGLRY